MEPAMAYVEETIDYISSTPDMIELYEARQLRKNIRSIGIV